MVEQFAAKLPNSMNKAELMEGGMTEEQADFEMQKRVFGADVKFTPEGKPVEQGAGSASHEAKLNAKGIVDTPHKKALELEAQRLALTGRGQPTTGDVITAAVTAGVKAGLQAGREEGL